DYGGRNQFANAGAGRSAGEGAVGTGVRRPIGRVPRGLPTTCRSAPTVWQTWRGDAVKVLRETKTATVSKHDVGYGGAGAHAHNLAYAAVTVGSGHHAIGKNGQARNGIGPGQID